MPLNSNGKIVIFVALFVLPLFWSALKSLFEFQTEVIENEEFVHNYKHAKDF
jgi:hypothetical protein